MVKMSVCVCQQEMAMELAAVKADMQGRVDTLQNQVNHWQNVTINILKDLYFGKEYVHKSCIKKEVSYMRYE